MKRAMGWVTLAIAMLAAGAARADYSGREIGNWLVSAKEDRFGDGGTYLAMTAGDGMIFGVRCIQKDLSAAVIFAEKELRTKDLFEFKFRVDKEPIVETIGVAINEHLIEIAIEGGLVKEMLDGKELAVRMKAATFTSTHVIKLRGASKAFVDIVKECPLDKSAKKSSEADTK